MSVRVFNSIQENDAAVCRDLADSLEVVERLDDSLQESRGRVRVTAGHGQLGSEVVVSGEQLMVSCH